MTIPDALKRDYQKRIASPDWKTLRKRLIAETGGGCERCLLITGELEVHHKTYERLWKERDEDLEVLCKRCHKIADQERANEGKRRASRALHNARLDGWASKRYGEDWEDYGLADQIAEEFENWLEWQES